MSTGTPTKCYNIALSIPVNRRKKNGTERTSWPRGSRREGPAENEYNESKQRENAFIQIPTH